MGYGIPRNEMKRNKMKNKKKNDKEILHKRKRMIPD